MQYCHTVVRILPPSESLRPNPMGLYGYSPCHSLQHKYPPWRTEEHNSQQKQTREYVVGIHSILDVWTLDGISHQKAGTVLGQIGK
jgi:hypothetical protein